MRHLQRAYAAAIAIGPLIVCCGLPARAQEAKPLDRAAAIRQPTSQRMTPAHVADAVEDELTQDPITALGNVDVQVKEGTATLSGTVDSLLARERAERIARTVKGVSTVNNQIEVRPLMLSDADDLESTIHEALLLNPATESYQVQVAAKPDGSVTLDGKVESWAERHLAGLVAKGVSGVTAVRNDIKVAYTRNRPDAEVAADIGRLLRWDVYLDDSRIDVGVHDGVVSLTGAVGSAAEKDRAINLAWLAGTQSVQADKLQVRSDGRDGMRKQAPGNLSDAAIAAAVRNRLELNPYVKSGSVQVNVDGRTATLSGQVQNLKAKRAAASAASAVYGVDRVRNRLHVSAPVAGGSNERQLESRIVGALAINPVTESYEIGVTVDGGTVDLAGTVDSWFEKGTADDVVAGIRGVREINNRLRVLHTHDRLTFDPYVDDWSVYAYDWYQPDRSTVWALDSTIRDEIQDQLWWSPFVDANEVHVSVLNGVATLTGTVDSAAESRAAQENAFEGGAAGVINHLRVES